MRTSDKTFQMASFRIISLVAQASLLSAQDTYDYDVIIMGAGAAGIGAAKTLSAANIGNFVIIEAHDYIGGRTRVVPFDDYSFNIGASWIAGACLNMANCSDYTEVNPMLEAALKYNISFVNSDYADGILLDVGGAEHNTTDTALRKAAFFEAYDCAWELLQSPNHKAYMSLEAALLSCGWMPPRDAVDKTIKWMNMEFEYGAHAKYASESRQVNTEFDSHERYGPQDLFITDPRGYQGQICQNQPNGHAYLCAQASSRQSRRNS
jgi:polyamine oxidase